MTSQDGQTPDGIGRRSFLRRSAVVGAGAVVAPAALAACATGGGGGDAKSTGAAGAKTKANPLGVDKKAPLEVVIFKGGYGDDYAKFDEKVYKKKYPGASIKHSGIQKINAELQPRFVSGNPPDAIDNSGDGLMDPAALVAQGQLADLAPMLNAPSVDIAGKTVQQSLLEGSLENGTFDKKVYALPYVLTVWAMWHDAKVFKDNGWEYPKTWSALLDLCAEIKKSGKMSPFIYAGVYPAYLRFPLHSMAFRISGKDVWKNVDNLETNAWKQGEIVEALTAFYKLAEKGYVFPGDAALTHTDSQSRWLQRKAALIPCGSWLENEMKGQIPKDFEMTAQPFPSVTDNDKVPFAAITYDSGEQFIVPEKAKNKNGGLEFLRIMCSKEAAQKFAVLTHSTTIVNGVHDEQDLGTAFNSVNVCIKNAKSVPRVPSPQYATWYKPLSDEVENALGAMMTKKVSPEATAARIQKKADAVKKDSGIKKHQR